MVKTGVLDWVKGDDGVFRRQWTRAEIRKTSARRYQLYVDNGTGELVARGSAVTSVDKAKSQSLVMPLTLAERCDLYKQAFPTWVAPWIDHNRINGMWMIGADYRNKSKLYGAYPNGYLKRVESMVPDLMSGNVLHLFAGSLPPGDYIRVDAMRDDQRDPDVQCDAQALPAHWTGRFDLIFADPPYSKEDATEYGHPMPHRYTVIKECARVLKPGGWLIWLDTQWPMHAKVTLPLVGQIGLVRSTQHRVRLISMFERTAAAAP